MKKYTLTIEVADDLTGFFEALCETGDDRINVLACMEKSVAEVMNSFVKVREISVPDDFNLSNVEEVVGA